MLLRFRNIFKLSQVSRSFCLSTVKLNDDKASKEITGSVSTKFQVFRNETGIIFDIEEERRRIEENQSEVYEEFPSAFEGLNLERKLSLFDYVKINIISF